MHRTNIYNYVLDSLDNILKNGLDYYENVDEELYDKLNQISNYIKDNSKLEKQEIVVSNKEENIKYDNIPNKVLDITKAFIKKVTEINIAVINLESDRCLYYGENKKEVSLGQETKLEETSSSDNSIIAYEEILEDNVFIPEAIDISEDSIEVDCAKNEKEEQDVPPKKSILDIFKW